MKIAIALEHLNVINEFIGEPVLEDDVLEDEDKLHYCTNVTKYGIANRNLITCHMVTRGLENSSSLGIGDRYSRLLVMRKTSVV